MGAGLYWWPWVEGVGRRLPTTVLLARPIGLQCTYLPTRPSPEAGGDNSQSLDTPPPPVATLIYSPQSSPLHPPLFYLIASIYPCIIHNTSCQSRIAISVFFLSICYLSRRAPVRSRPLVLRTQQRVSAHLIPAISTAGHAPEQRHSPLVVAPSYSLRYTRLAPPPPRIPHLPTHLRYLHTIQPSPPTEFAPPRCTSCPGPHPRRLLRSRPASPYHTLRRALFFLFALRSSTLCPFYHNRSRPHSVHILFPASYSPTCPPTRMLRYHPLPAYCNVVWRMEYT